VKVSSCGIGIATGDVFCGFVGAHHRCEWAVMGPSVNLAARLMGKAPVGTILIDDETYV
jgi:class 3 adenylate cyclase